MGGSHLNHKPIADRTLWLWCLLAVSSPLAVTAAENMPLTVAVFGAWILLLVWVTYSNVQESLPQWLRILQWLWMIPVLAEIIGMAANTWPDSTRDPVIPASMVLLAMWSAMGGTERTARTGTVLAMLAALLYAMLLFAGIKDIRLEYLSWRIDAPKGSLLTALLLPALLSYLPGQKNTSSVASLTGILVFSVMIAVLTGGILSSQVVRSLPQSFLEMAKGLTLFGTARRFEALTAAVLSMGWFAAISLLLCVSGALPRSVDDRISKGSILATAASALLLWFLKLQFHPHVLAVGSALIWCFLPIAAASAKKRKKEQKKEK